MYWRTEAEFQTDLAAFRKSRGLGVPQWELPGWETRGYFADNAAEIQRMYDKRDRLAAAAAPPTAPVQQPSIVSAAVPSPDVRLSALAVSSLSRAQLAARRPVQYRRAVAVPRLVARGGGLGVFVVAPRYGLGAIPVFSAGAPRMVKDAYWDQTVADLTTKLESDMQYNSERPYVGAFLGTPDQAASVLRNQADSYCANYASACQGIDKNAVIARLVDWYNNSYYPALMAPAASAPVSQPTVEYALYAPGSGGGGSAVVTSQPDLVDPIAQGMIMALMQQGYPRARATEMATQAAAQQRQNSSDQATVQAGLKAAADKAAADKAAADKAAASRTPTASTGGGTPGPTGGSGTAPGASIADLFSGSFQLGGFDIPVWAAAAGVGALFFFGRGR